MTININLLIYDDDFDTKESQAFKMLITHESEMLLNVLKTAQPEHFYFQYDGQFLKTHFLFCCYYLQN